MNIVRCTSCRGQKVWKDGLRKTRLGNIQRYVCRSCGHRFSEDSSRKTVNRALGHRFHRQICVSPERKAENLVTVEPLKDGLAGATADVQAKTIEHLWNLKKQGYQTSTIKLRSRLLAILVKLGANLLEPESVKATIANLGKSEGYKLQLVRAYDSFIPTIGLTWEPPRYRQTQKIPFIPLESEIDALIFSMGTKGATLLQILKETGMRKGEAYSLRWENIDTERRTITINDPEKNSNARTIKISSKLVEMLKQLRAKSDRIFTQGSVCHIERSFYKKRKQLAAKMQNPRFLRIKFHTFRHWKATMEYHKTKDILHVKQLLGHRNINNTLIYTQLVSFESDEYHVRIAKTLKEACELAEAGFEYFTVIENVQVFRKRK